MSITLSPVRRGGLGLCPGAVRRRNRGFGATYSLVTCDAGLKALYTDGPPRASSLAPRRAAAGALGDEHGAIIHPDFVERLRSESIDAIDAASASPADAPAEGALVWLQPGHVDPTVALHDAFLVADEAGNLERWPIDGRRTT